MIRSWLGLIMLRGKGGLMLGFMGLYIVLVHCSHWADDVLKRVQQKKGMVEHMVLFTVNLLIIMNERNSNGMR